MAGLIILVIFTAIGFVLGSILGEAVIKLWINIKNWLWEVSNRGE